MYYRYLPTPIGDLLLAGDDDALRIVSFPDGSRRRDPAGDWIYSERPFVAASEQLQAYFDGDLQEFTLPLKPTGTAFQLAVLAELEKIPYGTTTSYGEIARRIGRPRAVRAVGAANGRNPIPVIIPCHRVIGSTGKLTGFGGGLPVKEALLRLEMEHSCFPHVG